MLLVLAVMSLLMYLLVPAMTKAMSVASRQQCSSHLRGMMSAYSLYAEDYDNSIVPAFNVNTLNITHYYNKEKTEFFFGSTFNLYVGGPKITWTGLLHGLGYMSPAPMEAKLDKVNGYTVSILPDNFHCPEKEDEGPVPFLTGGQNWMPNYVVNWTFSMPNYHKNVDYPKPDDLFFSKFTSRDPGDHEDWKEWRLPPLGSGTSLSPFASA